MSEYDSILFDSEKDYNYILYEIYNRCQYAAHVNCRSIRKTINILDTYIENNKYFLYHKQLSSGHNHNLIYIFINHIVQLLDVPY